MIIGRSPSPELAPLLDELPLELPLGVASAIENHRFSPIKRVRWRNDDLVFDSVKLLQESLAVRPTRRVLAMAFEAEDAAALSRLAERIEIRDVARGLDRVRLLWDVCTIPDFRKLLIEAHVDFLAEVYVELVNFGHLDDAFVSRHVRPLESTDGEVELLVARIAAVRTWTYVSNRATWLQSPGMWQERTRNLEDRLSDALHERLVMRFVDTKKKVSRQSRGVGRIPGSTGSLHAVPSSATAFDASHPFAKLAGMRVAPEASAPILPVSWLEATIAAPHADLDVDASGRILHRPSGRAVGALARGTSIARPDVRLLDSDGLGAGAKSRLLRRLLAFVRDVSHELVGGLFALAEDESATIRGLVHRVEQGLGTALDVHDLVAALDDEELERVQATGLAIGHFGVWVPESLGPEALARRAILGSVFYRLRVDAPRRGAVSLHVSLPPDVLVAIAHPRFGPRAIRIDIAERAVAHLADEDPTAFANMVGCTLKEAPRVAEAMRQSSMSTGVPSETIRAI